MLKVIGGDGVYLSDIEVVKHVCALLMGEAYEAGRHKLIHENGPNNKNYIKWRDKRIEIMFDAIGLGEK